MQLFEKSERDRDIAYARNYNEKFIGEQIEKTFGVRMTVPKGYVRSPIPCGCATNILRPARAF